MKKVGIVSCNIHCNFTNYGSALQSWALSRVLSKLSCVPILVDYCPKVLENVDTLNPFNVMWDKDEESRRMCELTLPAIRENYQKFDSFYTQQFNRTQKMYNRLNFNEIMKDEKLDGFVCGSDTIFCVDEFGIDDGYYANYECMRGKSISYAASFGDSHFTSEMYKELDVRLGNFKALGIREKGMLSYIQSRVNVPADKVLDPTLLLSASEYETIVSRDETVPSEPYLLMYSRRYNPRMEAYAINLAQKNNWKIVEISLRATNAEKGHIMRYDAGVEEFLALTKRAQYIVTNSFHSMIFAVQFQRPFVVFSREQCDTKIDELLELFGLENRKFSIGEEKDDGVIDYNQVCSRINEVRNQSFLFLRNALELL